MMLSLWRVDATHECGEFTKFFEHDFQARHWADTLSALGWLADWYQSQMYASGRVRDALVAGIWPNVDDEELIAQVGDPVLAARRSLAEILERRNHAPR